MKKMSEESLQNKAVIWFNNNYCLKHHTPRLMLFTVPNEIAMKVGGILLSIGVSNTIVDKVVAIVSSSMKSVGLLPGVSDTVIVGNGRVFFVEFKLPTNYQQDNQKEFESRVTSLGHTYVVIKSLDQFQKFVKEVVCSTQN